VKIRGIDATFLLVKDMKRARTFYDGLLGIEPSTVHAEYWAEYELPDGATFALGNNPSADWRPGSGILLGIEGLDEGMQRVKDLGGTVTDVEMNGESCKAHECIDTEGNYLYLHERK